MGDPDSGVDHELEQSRIDLIDAIKQQGVAFELALDAARSFPNVDARALGIAKTHLQTGHMWLMRAIMRPGGF